MAFRQQAHRTNRRENPRQFANLGHGALAEKNGTRRVQSAGEEINGDFPDIFTQCRGIARRGHRMVVGDEVKGLALVLEADGGFDRAEVISDMKFAAGLEAG